MGRAAGKAAAAAVVAAVLVGGCAPGTGAGGTAAGPSAGSTGPSARAAGPTAGAGAAGAAAGPSASAPGAARPARVAAKGGTLGAPGSACPLPVTFDVAAAWVPKRIKPVDDPDLRDLLDQGTVTIVCEIDAKPAGNIGFLRVWTDGDAAATPREVLESFVAGDDSPGSVVHRDVEPAADPALPAAEVTYVVTSPLLGERKKVRALAVVTPAGPVVLELGGMDTDEHEGMLPAYELAKGSLAAARR
ncbi:lipoprotein [Streptomyces changanensis]|uniref:Lipoprotein n=1 Tax=Streptomyces changanensis TaxID=2964669 RepID=A0ABY5NFG0_9ACTN|nr:lipoprotein [Streptomyces kanasensis]UUS34799.1 lipoprotein [Streptomyces changanensis]